MSDSKVLTKFQSAALIAVIVVAAVGGGVAYVLWSEPAQPTETIRIGVCGDLDYTVGKAAWQGAILAAEQVNAEGGVLGRNFTIVAEDDDSSTLGDIAVSNNAFTKLITFDNADYILDFSAGTGTFAPKLEIAADHRKILFSNDIKEEYTQLVIDNYNRYKYFFRVITNETSTTDGMIDSILTLGNYTGFTKIAILVPDNAVMRATASELNSTLSKHGFEIVYNNVVSPSITDFTSYFAVIEASGAQILAATTYGRQSVSFVKEYSDRQSPFVVWGLLVGSGESDFWDLTEGKAESITSTGLPITSGYPLTSKTVPTREAYYQRWGELPTAPAAAAYDVVRFILADAIRRAGTTETEAVIEALEKTDIETSLARRFVFTSNHDVMVGAAGPNRPGEDYMLVCKFQWQNGTLVPVYPKEIMEEAGATYMYPDWLGPWD